MSGRIAYWADESYERDGLFGAIAFEEDKPGYWGVGSFPTLAAAQRFAQHCNDTHGYTSAEVVDIYASSLRAGRVPNIGDQQ